MELVKPSEQIQAIKEGKLDIDELLAPPGKHIGEVSLDTAVIDPLVSGFASLDEYLWLKKGQGELVVIGGRPSHGKSGLMFQTAAQVAKHTPVHIFSLEMSEEQVAQRMACQFLNRPLTALQRGTVPKAELARATAYLKSLKYIIDQRAGLSVVQLADAARQWAKKQQTGLIVVDYLQLLRAERSHSRDVEIGMITLELKALAKELRCPVIVGSQLNRQCEARGLSSGDFRPQLSDLRESGSIEADSDVVVFVSRESRYNGKRPDEADITVAKNRNGPCGEIVMKWAGAQTMFLDGKQEEI